MKTSVDFIVMPILLKNVTNLDEIIHITSLSEIGREGWVEILII